MILRKDFIRDHPFERSEEQNNTYTYNTQACNGNERLIVAVSRSGWAPFLTITVKLIQLFSDFCIFSERFFNFLRIASEAIRFART